MTKKNAHPVSEVDAFPSSLNDVACGEKYNTPSSGLLLSRLDAVRQTKPGSWIARCPAHEDQSPSLSVRETDDGRTLVHCFSGCDAPDVVQAVGLDMADLFPPRAPGDHHRAPTKPRPDYRGAWLVIQHTVSVLLVAAEQLRHGEPLSDEDHALVRACWRRITEAGRVLV